MLETPEIAVQDGASEPRRRTVDALDILSFPSRQAMAARAARDMAAELRRRLSEQASVRMVFAAAPSQADTLAGLMAAPDIDWSRVTAFHMDEYVGLPPAAPQRFANWLDERVFSQAPFAAIHRLAPGEDASETARDYARRLDEAPIDVIGLGIGVNGHIAFNDPPAELDDPLDVKVVDLDRVCRQQQVDDDCFDSLDTVPRQAITLTVPRLMRAERLFCVVPASAKRDAVRKALHGPISGDCPASVLRRHPACTLYLEPASDPDV